MIPSEHTFANLIGIEGAQWLYHIPRFQREYVWAKYNWSKLLEDIYDNDPGHYMGSVICVHDSSELSPTSELVYEVVDGQQRLTTLSLLLAAVYSKLTKEALKGNAHLKQDPNYMIKTIGISQRLVRKVDLKGKQLPWGFFKAGKEVYCLRVQPSTQDYNLEDYQFLLSEVGLLSQARYIHGYGKGAFTGLLVISIKTSPTRLIGCMICWIEFTVCHLSIFPKPVNQRHSFSLKP